MRIIRVVVVLLLVSVAAWIGYMKWFNAHTYTPFRNETNFLTSFTDHYSTAVVAGLRPMFRSCTETEMLDPQGAVAYTVVHRPKMKECSAVLVYDPGSRDGGFELINWEVPEDTDDSHHLDNTIAVLDVAEKSKDYGIIMGAVVAGHFCGLSGRPNGNGGGSLEWFPACPDADRRITAPPVQLSAATAEHVRGSVGHPWDALPELRGVLRHVFGDDIRKFEFATDGPGELTLNGDEAFFHFCKSHACPDHEAALAINLSDGRAAGALIENGSLYTYEGDYASKDAVPQNLQTWIKENTEP